MTTRDRSPSIGQEASAVGQAFLLDADDHILDRTV